ncbi:hypothetical protein [Leptospira licerasiae]|uniref:DUF1285 domain-containing protein n=1 Tax=Leptospira licerasiae str. MMD4847 TaxID=1049971 RepID=A0ABN0H8C0_9LEPT|nr:hypothetical protein [Leptospira licerasiae]EIE00182.1 hypothetical protein LEP1GSC185_2482 [Leptospira licerasiae serovar Varillal str. VAR 010]EJZ41808.1 hypothetical protein LEP1GSC178_0256 [Leptospira licerasiae str. MMD4847]
MARRLDSEIKVLPNGDWIFREAKIEQKDILEYFRKNLKEAEDGIYIDNQYGEFSENGYLELFGYPLNLIRIWDKDGEFYFLSDSGEELPLSSLQIAADSEGELFARKKDHLFLKYKIARNVSSILSEYLSESPQGLKLVFQNREVPILETGEHPNVSLPKEFQK